MPVYKDEARGTWFVSIRYKNWAGKADRKVKRGFKRERDAKKWEHDFMAQQAANCDMTLGALAELYFEDLESRIKESTIDTKRIMFDTKILPYFSETPVNEITAASIRRWQSALMKQRQKNGELYKPTYLRSINSQLSAILNYAVTFYSLQANPCKAAGMMGKKKAEAMKIWTVDEFNTAMATVSDPAKHLAFSILFWGGVRVGECLDLRPADLLHGDKLKIEKTYHRRGGEDTTGSTKSENSKRIVTIPDFVAAEIREYTSKLHGLGKHDRIFYFTHSTVNVALTQAAAAAGVKRIRVHDLRHSHAAMLIELGYSIPLLAERLGDTIQVVSETYTHLYPNKQDEVAKELAKHRNGIIPVSQK